jgi:hypothetical protein
MLAMQLSWFESRHVSKITNGRHKQRSGKRNIARQKEKENNKKEKKVSTEGQVTYDFTSFPGIFRLLYCLDHRMSIW